MEALVGKYPKVFHGLGRATKVLPVHIEIDDMVTLIQQKQQLIPIHYKEKLRKHLKELVSEGVVTALLDTQRGDHSHEMVGG